MIHSLFIQRYRGLYSVTLSSLARVNIIFGNNNSGKTSILEAFCLVCNPTDPESWWQRGVTESSETRLEWHGGKNGSPGVAVCLGDSISVQVGGESTEFCSSCWGSDVIPKNEYTPVILLSHSLDHTDFSFIQDTAGAKKDLVSLLSAFDSGVEDVFYSSEFCAVCIQHKQRGVIPLSHFGDGFRQALSYALALIQCRNGVLLIDGIGNMLKASAFWAVYSWLLKACEKYNVQLFATTSSNEIFNAALNVTEKEDVAFYQLRGECAKNGIIRASKIDVFRDRWQVT